MNIEIKYTSVQEDGMIDYIKMNVYPLEYMVIHDAIRKYIQDGDIHPADLQLAKRIDKQMCGIKNWLVDNEK